MADKEATRDLSIAKSDYQNRDRALPPYDPESRKRVGGRRQKPLTDQNTTKFFKETFLDLENLGLQSTEKSKEK